MAKIHFLRLCLVIIVVCAALVSAQAQSKKQKQKAAQQQALKARPKPGLGASGIVINKNGKRKEKPKEGNGKDKQKFVTKQLPNLGRIRGRLSTTLWSGKPLMQFLDIPYGKSPTGPLRFKASVPAEPWENVLLANKPHPGCPALQDFHKFAALEAKNYDIEDCLKLTVNTKSFVGAAPVMVYVHGDFLYDGNSFEAAPGYLLEEDIVLVSVRYRLGPFGFLSTMSEEIPGNAAVFDVILALQWIQKHIAAFGGDPNKVTLMGQVGGSALINILTMSPVVPKGLFHQVIYSSGSALSPAFITDKPITAARDIAKFSGCKSVGKVEGINKCIRNLNTTALLVAFNAHGDAKASMGVGSYGGVQFVIGGPSNVLPEHPGKLLGLEKFTAYPTLGGTVKNPGTFILKDIYIDNFNETIIDDKLDGIGYINHIITQTNGADPAGAWRKYAEEEVFTQQDIKNGSFYRLLPGLIDMCGVIPFKNPVLLAIQANAKKLVNSTYLYSFEYEGEQNRYSTNADEEGSLPFELGASLTDENLYLFPWPKDSILNSNRDIKIAKRMVSLWTSFAKNGVPQAPDMPQWPTMSDETGPYLKLGKTVSTGDNYLDEYTAAVKDYQAGYNLANDDFFDSLVEITNANKDGKQEEDEDEDGNGVENDEDNEGRGTSYVLIARRTKKRNSSS